MSKSLIPDPIAQGLASGWSHLDASTLTQDRDFDTDVVIIGTGAGGALAAELLSKAGLRVLMVEHGAFYSSSDFRQQERWAYPNLYQDGAGRKTKDQAIGILQGRTVGGSTTVNWTTSIRTPKGALAYWHEQFGVDFGDELTPYFDKACERLSISEWALTPNANNGLIQRGCEKLGWSYTIIHRNVNGCANTGYCGMGCPINAKQSMLVTTIPTALSHGATLISRAQAWQLQWQGDAVSGLLVHPVDAQFQPNPAIAIRIKAKHYVLAGGAINSPALLLRSNVPNPSGRLGKHTYLHPSVICGALFDEDVKGAMGAPQSVYSDQFVWPSDPHSMGFKLEAAPVHPVLMASKLAVDGQAHADLMAQFNQLAVTIALLRDGYHVEAQGGQVELDSHGQPMLDYPLTEYFWRGVRQAYLAMAELQFAAGAKAVMPIHQQAQLYSSLDEAKAAINALPLERYQATVASAHVMGGCNFSADPANGVVRPDGRHHQLANLSVLDGSVLPTSLGANPQLTIYGLTWRNTELLIEQLRKA